MFLESLQSRQNFGETGQLFSGDTNAAGRRTSFRAGCGSHDRGALTGAGQTSPGMAVPLMPVCQHSSARSLSVLPMLKNKQTNKPKTPQQEGMNWNDAEKDSLVGQKKTHIGG